MRYVLIGVMLLFAVPAHADCMQAKQRVEKAVDTYDRWSVLAIKDATGGKDTYFDFNYFVKCRKMVPVAKEQLRYVEEILELNEDAHRICKTEDEGTLNVGEYPAMSTRAMLKEYIVVCEGGHGED